MLPQAENRGDNAENDRRNPRADPCPSRPRPHFPALPGLGLAAPALQASPHLSLWPFPHSSQPFPTSFDPSQKRPFRSASASFLQLRLSGTLLSVLFALRVLDRPLEKQKQNMAFASLRKIK